MLRFEHFELADGVRLDARIERGRVHVLPLDPEHVQEDFIARYLAIGETAGDARGELWLEEVRDPAGRPVALRALPAEKLRGFFARFVGFVLRDGGLVDELTVRENVTLSQRYHEVWPRGSARGGEVAEVLRELAGDDVEGVAGTELLDRRPGEMTAFARRYWGWMTTLVRRPQLVVAFAPFDGLRAADRAAIAGLLQRYRKLEPASAHLLVTTGAHETEALAGVEVTELRAESR